MVVGERAGSDLWPAGGPISTLSRSAPGRFFRRRANLRPISRSVCSGRPGCRRAGRRADLDVFSVRSGPGACNRPCPKGPTNICSNPSDLAPCMPCGEAQNQRTRPSLNAPKNKFPDLSDLAWSLSSVSVHWALQGAKGLHGPKPYKLIGFGGLHGPEPYKCTSVGGIHPQVYKLIKAWWRPRPRTT